MSRRQTAEAIATRAEEWASEADDETPTTSPAKSEGGRGPSKATRAVGYAQNAGADLWHDPDGKAYADVRGDDGVRWTICVRTRAFRTWLSRVFYEEEGSVIGGQAATDAADVLAAKAIYDGPEHDVHVRIASGPDGEIYLDLGDDGWSAVRVTSTGWNVVSEPTVRFRRPRGLRPLPEPVRDGCLDDLRHLLNVDADRDWILVVAWLVATMRPTGPYPVLAPTGEAGSAKTTLGKILRHMVDPNLAPLRGPPRSGRDLVIAASNSHVVALDNLSSIPDWLSDALCRVACGDGFSTRELYSDGEETIFAGSRPILLTGIEEVITRGDLADRAIPLALPRIPDHMRRTESELWAEVDRIRPSVLGALLDVVVVGLGRVASVKLKRIPRMADFATWVVACEPALPWPDGAFLAAYDDARGHVIQAGIEADLVAGAVLEFISEVGTWEGTSGELLDALNGRRAIGSRPPKDWPETPRSMSGKLDRAAPLLRGVGVEVEKLKRRKFLRYTGENDRTDRPDRQSRTDRPPDRPADDPHSTTILDGGDGMDGRMQPRASDTQRPTSDVDDSKARAGSSRDAPRPELDLWTGGPQDPDDLGDAIQTEGLL